MKTVCVKVGLCNKCIYICSQSLCDLLGCICDQSERTWIFFCSQIDYVEFHMVVKMIVFYIKGQTPDAVDACHIQ